MKSFPKVAISEVAKVITGGTPATAREEFYGGDIPFVTPADLDLPNSIVTTPRSLSALGAKQVRLVPANSVMVCCIGSLGKVGISGREVATNQQINSIIFDQTKVWPKFGYYACRLLKPALIGMAPATTVAIVSKSKFQALEIPLPPLDEQKRIAAILDQADELRRKRQHSIDRLNQLGQAIFYEMFGDPSTNPKGWPIGVIGDLAASTQYGTSAKAGENGSHAILRMGNLTIDGRIDLSKLKYIDFEKHEIEKYTVVSGDLLFNRTNSPDLVGKTAVYYGNEPIGFAGYLVRLRTNSLAVPEYISAFLNSPFGKKVLRGMCKAIIGMANINAKELQTIPIAIPPIGLQRKFQAKFLAAQAAMDAPLEHSDHLATLFSALQHRAFRGEL